MIRKSYDKRLPKKLGSPPLTKLIGKPFITPAILTPVLAFGLSAFEHRIFYSHHKVNYSPKDISIAITGGGIFGALFQIYFFDKFMKYSELTFIAWSLIYSSYCISAISYCRWLLTIMVLALLSLSGSI